MQRIFITILWFFLFISCTAHAAKTTYLLDSAHSYVLWLVDHFGFSKQSGKFFADGSLVLDDQRPENSSVNVVIQIASLNTGNKELDQHLQGGLFFNGGSYPLATFVSKKVVQNGAKTAKVLGTMTIRGVSKPVVLDVKFNKIGNSIITNKTTAGFTAVGKISRSDFGITTLLPGLGDEVNLIIEVEAYKA